jgi:RNA polymerase sigma-70 factor (ECF subfamily)
MVFPYTVIGVSVVISAIGRGGGQAFDEVNKNEKLIEEVAIENDKQKQLNKAINKLPEKYKEVILLYYFEERNYEEISDIMRVSVTHVGVLIFRAKDKLKSILKTYEKQNF